MASGKVVPGFPAKKAASNQGFVAGTGLSDITALVTFNFAGPNGVFTLYQGQQFQVDAQTKATMVAQGLVM